MRTRRPGSTASPGMRGFRLLALGSAVSSYGNFLSMVALSLFAYHVTGSSLQTGLFLAVRLGASVAAGPLAGAAATRFDRKPLLVIADLVQAATLVTLVAAPGPAQPTLLYGVALVAGLCGTLSSVALRSSIPEIVGSEHRVRANALLVTGRSIAMVAGFASAGLVIAALGFTAALLIDAGTFLFSAANLARLPITTRAAPSSSPSTTEDSEPAGYRAALRFLRLSPILFAMILLRAIDSFGSASHNVGLPVLSSQTDPGHPATLMAQFWTVWAIGNLIAQRAVTRWLRDRTQAVVGEWGFALGAAVMSGAFILAFTTPPRPAAIVVALVAGLADGFTEIAYVSRLQTAPDTHRGHVFGFSTMVENVGFGVGMALSAGLIDRLGPFPVVAIFHGVAVALALLFVAVLLVRRRGRRPAAVTVEPSGAGQ